jgi:cell division protein FtsB
LLTLLAHGWRMIRRKFDLVVMIVCLSLLGYFAWHAFHGPRGFAYQARLEARAHDLSGQLDAIRKERDRLEKRVSLMRPDSIDPDMLDELARANLGYGKPGDLVIMTTR